MGKQLTEKERKTLNAAMGIILGWMPEKSSFQLGPANFHGTPICTVTYFTASGTQKSSLWRPGSTFADKIQMAMDVEAEEAQNVELVRQRRIERLKDELDRLTGVAA